MLKYELICKQITEVFEELWQQVVDVILSVDFGLLVNKMQSLLIVQFKIGVCAAKMA